MGSTTGSLEVKAWAVGLIVVVADAIADTFLVYAVTPEWVKENWEALIGFCLYRAFKSGAMYFRQSPLVKKYRPTVDNEN